MHPLQAPYRKRGSEKTSSATVHAAHVDMPFLKVIKYIFNLKINIRT